MLEEIWLVNHSCGLIRVPVYQLNYNPWSSTMDDDLPSSVEQIDTNDTFLKLDITPIWARYIYTQAMAASRGRE